MSHYSFADFDALVSGGSNTIYGVKNNEKVIKLSRNSHIFWEKKTPQVQSIYYYFGNVICQTKSGKLISYDEEFGLKNWEIPFNGRNLTLKQGYMFSVDSENRLQAHDIETGIKVWSFPVKKTVIGLSIDKQIAHVMVLTQKELLKIPVLGQLPIFKNALNTPVDPRRIQAFHYPYLVSKSDDGCMWYNLSSNQKGKLNCSDANNGFANLKYGQIVLFESGDISLINLAKPQEVIKKTITTANVQTVMYDAEFMMAYDTNNRIHIVNYFPSINITSVTANRTFSEKTKMIKLQNGDVIIADSQWDIYENKATD